MEAILNQFKQVAPYVVIGVKEKVTAAMSESEVMAVIHEEIVAYFTNHSRLAIQHMTLGSNDRATFASVMYELLKPLTSRVVATTNPLYEEYVRRSGKTGARNYITNA